MSFNQESWGQISFISILEKIYSRARRTGWIPPCVRNDDYDCVDCTYTDLDTCEMLQDSDVRNLIEYEKEKYYAELGFVDQRTEAILDILKLNQISFHVSVLAIIASNEYPELFYSVKYANKFVYEHKEYWLVEGGIVKPLHLH